MNPVTKIRVQQADFSFLHLQANQTDDLYLEENNILEHRDATGRLFVGVENKKYVEFCNGGEALASAIEIDEKTYSELSSLCEKEKNGNIRFNFVRNMF